MENKNLLSNFNIKYGSLIARYGFTQIPNLLIKHWKVLGLTKSEYLLALNLLVYDHTDSACFPSLKEIAVHTRMSSATVSKAVKGLEEKKLFEIRRRNGMTSIYNSIGLRRKIRALAKTQLENSYIHNEINEDEFKSILQKDSMYNTFLN